MSSPRSDLPRIHVVTSDEVIGRPGFAAAAATIMRRLGEAGALHLRAPRATGRRVHELAIGLAAVQSDAGCWLVVNDRVDVARVSGARGVQLTSRSMSVADARAIGDGLRIGASVHAAAEADAAREAGADWCVAGHVFETPSHPGEPGRGLEFLAAVARSGLPTIAIGGIRPAHADTLVRHGAHGVAVIRGIWDAPDAERAAAEYLSAYGDARSSG